MDIKEARQVLMEAGVVVVDGDRHDFNEARKVAIKELGNIMTPVIDEYISAEEAIELLSEYCEQFDLCCEGCELDFRPEDDLSCVLHFKGRSGEVMEVLKRFKYKKMRKAMHPVQRAIVYAEELIKEYENNGVITDIDIKGIIDTLQENQKDEMDSAQRAIKYVEELMGKMDDNENITYEDMAYIKDILR